MAERSKRWPAIYVVVSLLLLWELLHYLGLTDPIRFSHPIGILQVLGDLNFVIGFGVMLVQLALTFLMGGGIGVLFGVLIVRSQWFTQATIRFFRIGLWVPLMIPWVILIWPLQKEYKSINVLMAWALSVGAIALSACYNYLIMRSTLGLEWREARPQVARSAILQALLISLVFQLWISPYGWDWFFSLGPGGVAVVYTALILVVVFLFLVDLVFKSDFNHTAGVRGNILVREMTGRGRNSLWGAMVLGLVCTIVWQLLSEGGYYPLISSPFEALKMAYRLLITGTSIPQMAPTLWGDIGTSLLEVVGGLILSGGLALVGFRGLSINATFRSWALPLVPLTYITPFGLSLLLLHWEVLLGSWKTTAGVALLAFFPFIQVLWGLRDRPLACRIFLAADDSLPYAFVGMLFGETMSSTAGLGFFMVVVPHLTHQPTERLAAFLVTLALLIALSSTLRWVAKRFYQVSSRGV